MHKINTDTIQEKLVKPSIKKHQPSWLSALSFNFPINDDVHCTKSMIQNPFFTFKNFYLYKFMRWLKSKGKNMIFGGIDGSDGGTNEWYEFWYARFISHEFSDDRWCRWSLFVCFIVWFTKKWQKHFFFTTNSRSVLNRCDAMCDCDWVRNCIHKLISLDKKNMGKMLRCGWHTTQYAILFDLSFILRWK